MTRPNFSTVISGSGQYSTNGGQSWTDTTIADVYHAEEQVIGVSRRKPKGWIPPTPYTLKRARYQRPIGFISWVVSPSNKYDSRGALSRPSNIANYWGQAYLQPDSPVDSGLYNEALIKARLKLKDQKVNLGVAFFERKKTCQMVGDNLTAIAKSVRSLRKGDWRRAARHLGISNPKKPRGSSVPKRWLEYQYGWRPLLQDIHGALEALDERPGSDWRVTTKGSAIRKQEINKVMPDSSLYSIRDEVSVTHRCLVRIDAIPSKDHITSLASLGITNPLEIAWELVPFSFVVDWAIPVGDYLSSLDAMLGWSGDQTWHSITYYQKSVHKTSFVNGSGLYNARGHFGNCGYEKLRLQRTVGTSVPLPGRPYLKDPRSLNHVANALSLLAQAFGR